MKKFVFVSLFVLCSLLGKAQHYEALDAEELWNSGVQTSYYCSTDDELLGIIVYGVGNYCSDQVWWLQDFSGILIDGINADSIVISNPHEYHEYQFTINGCYDIGGIPMFELTHSIIFDILPLNPFDGPILWKRHNDAITLSAPWIYSPVWSPGGNAPNIEALEQGVYLVTLANSCGSATYSVDVLNILEIYRAGVDLASRKNKPTWRTTPEQALHIKDVQVIRDGIPVGVAPFEQCYYLDSIGSDDAARTYQLVAILYDGTVCPYSSYRIGTPHVDYSQNASDPNKLNFAWTNPFIEEDAPISIAYVLICKYDPYTGQVTIIDQLDPSNTIGSYDKDKFNNGYAAVGFIFNEGESEAEMKQNLDKKLKKFAKDVTMTLDEFDEVAFGNMSQDIILAVGEHHVNPINVYPNPCDGAFTVTGVSNLVIYNILGQVVTTSYSESGTHNLSLGYGLYILKDPEGNVAKLIIK